MLIPEKALGKLTSPLLYYVKPQEGQIQGGYVMRDEVTNRVSMTGCVLGFPTFSHETYGERFYTVMFGVYRSSGVMDEVPLMMSDRLTDLSQLDGSGDCFLNIIGQIRSYNKHEEGGHNRLQLSVFVTEILDMPEGYEEGKDINQVELSGFICKEPVYRKTPLGREICDILMAVNRAYGKSDYIPMINWGRNARWAGGLEVGQQFTIKGRWQSRDYTKKLSETETEQRRAYEVSISKLYLGDEDDCNC